METTSKRNETKAPSGIRISLMGSEGSGKTCFFAGLSWLGGAAQRSEFGLVGRDEASQAFVNELRETLARNELPQSTRKTDDLALDILYRGTRIGIDIENFAGEEFRAVGTELRSGSPLFEKYLRSQYLVLFLDIENDVDRNVAENADRLDAVLNLLSTEAFCDRSRKLAIVLTKSDLRGFAGPKATSAAARDYLKARKPGLFEKIERLGYDKRFFFLAPIGRSTLSDGQPPDPFGYEALFDWIVGDIRARRTASWIRRHRIPLVAAGVAILLAAGFGIGSHVQRILADRRLVNPNATSEEIDRTMESASQQAKDKRIDKEIVDMEEKLPSVDSLSRLEGFQNRVAQLKGVGSAIIDGRLSELDRQLREKREDLLLAQLRELERLGDIARCRETIGRYYLDDLASKRRTDEVKDIGKRLDNREQGNKRAEIRSVVVESRRLDKLKSKCDLVDKFDFPDPATKRDAARAVAVGRLFLSCAPYHVEIKGASGLPSAHRTRLELSNLGPTFSQHTETTHQKSRSPQWDTKVNFQWKPGDRIRIEWLWSSHWGPSDTTIGKKDFSDPWTALLDALGGVALDPDTGAFHARLNGSTPRATIICSEFPEPSKDAQLFRLYIAPGTYWQD